MTTEEMKIVASIVVTADGGYCTNCASDLIEKLIKVWPEHEAVIVAAYEQHFKGWT